MTIDVCQGQPSHNVDCPKKHICQFHIDFKRTEKLHYMNRPMVSYISAFYCSSKDWHKFEPFQEEVKENKKFITLTNDMVIKYEGKVPTKNLDIYQIVLPLGQKTVLLYDGAQFFSTIDDNLLEPHTALTGVSIKTKGTENGKV